MNKNSRYYQNLIHIFGSISSVLTIYGAVLVGKDSIYGLPVMIGGAVVTRILSQLEYRKMFELIGERNGKDKR